MVIGNGDLASVLPDREDRLYFASGVSNSQETNEDEYQAEKDLFNQIPYFFKDEFQLIYFSSLGVLTSDSRYFKHKLEMEQLAKTWPKYAIIRIGNITWKSKNPNTI